MAQARARPGQARIPGPGPGLGFLKPKPDEARPEPWFPGQAKPAHHYVTVTGSAKWARSKGSTPLINPASLAKARDGAQHFGAERTTRTEERLEAVRTAAEWE
ncbi:hypothetical protein B0H11DRAFT_2187491 [Mycena galericulata]|nr:hypothetical protein B0H11DRAFT_2187491 [Mycena galericulata]